MKNQPLDVAKLTPNPLDLFDEWYKEHLKFPMEEPAAALLATASKAGRPDSRTVLLKSYAESGFVFVTNYESHKGQQMLQNPLACMTFYWDAQSRQVHVHGRAEKVNDQEADELFYARPRESQLSTWVSRQSSEIPLERDFLENKMMEIQKKYEGKTVPRPSYWGGFRLIPNELEFWQGRINRLHDRFLYRREQNNWKMVRLSP